MPTKCSEKITPNIQKYIRYLDIPGVGQEHQQPGPDPHLDGRIPFEFKTPFVNLVKNGCKKIKNCCKKMKNRCVRIKNIFKFRRRHINYYYCYYYTHYVGLA
jgi:hypothetical protein